MKVLVTGGAGYIGTALIEKLAMDAKCNEIIVYDNLSRQNYNLFLYSDFKSANVRFIQADILDSRRLKRELKNVDVVIHLAAKVSTPFSNEDSHSFEQINHWGTAELTYAIEESQVRQVIFLSSTSVYGSTDSPVNEEHPLNTQTYYGISKMRGENHLNVLNDRYLVHIIRSGNVYGFNPSMRFDSVINRFVFEANSSGRINIHGNGKQIRAFVCIDTVAETLSRLIVGHGDDPMVPRGTYNLVEQNRSILNIGADLKEIYPELEFIFIDQHMPKRSLQVDPSLKLLEKLSICSLDMTQSILKLKKSLAF